MEKMEVKGEKRGKKKVSGPRGKNIWQEVLP